MTVLFERGSFPVCTAVTNARGNAACGTTGHRDIFTATYFGDPSHRPASVQFGRADPNPPAQPPSFPACAQFDSRSVGVALVDQR